MRGTGGAWRLAESMTDMIFLVLIKKAAAQETGKVRTLTFFEIDCSPGSACSRA